MGLAVLFFLGGVWAYAFLGKWGLMALVGFGVMCALVAAAISVALDERRETEKARDDADVFRQSLVERASGYPSLAAAIARYEELRDEALSSYLAVKKHPAVRSAEILREASRERRNAQAELRQSKALLEYYETVAPFLIDLRDEVFDEDDVDRLREYTEEEKADTVTLFLTKEEYRNLPSAERNQMALDRFWSRQKSKRLLGRIYERYVGYLYEKHGYDVEFVGIFRGYQDLGRDLICRKPGSLIVVQCKNWSQFKTIYEKHIFQFFGTVFQYRDENPGDRVRAIFYTTTRVSDLARRFAAELGIELEEQHRMDKSYPSVKCNISRVNGEKIYHLPIDQQYDNVKVEFSRGELYCTTVAEAEEMGFRRAFRYRGDGNSHI